MNTLLRSVLTAAAMSAATLAQAHEGHGVESLLHGHVHWLEADHLAAVGAIVLGATLALRASLPRVARLAGLLLGAGGAVALAFF